MDSSVAVSVLGRKYQEIFGASPVPSFSDYIATGREPDSLATLGYRRASEGRVFLESYLDAPVEAEVSRVFGRPIDRSAIVEIGNFAADNALVMLELWGTVANDLAGSSEVAVATLTRPLRSIFRGVGVPFIAIAPASPERLGSRAAEWGTYYEQDPEVCVGEIARGQAAIAAWRARRGPRTVA